MTTVLERTLLAMPPGAQPRRLSALNADGTPQQLCFSSSTRGIHARMIAEPALHVQDPLIRLSCVRSALHGVLTMSDSVELSAVAESALDTFGPRHDGECDTYPDGILWLAASINGPGAAIYLDARRGGQTAAWDRVHAWFARVMPSSAQATETIAAVRHNVTLLCVALEGSRLGNARVKLYWRLPHILRLRDVGVALFERPEFSFFAALAIADRNIRVSGLVFSVGFALADGRLTDAKLDICACEHCISRPPAQWSQLLAESARHFGVSPFMPDMLKLGRPAFLGLGLTARGEPRLNCYLNPSAAA